MLFFYTCPASEGRKAIKFRMLYPLMKRSVLALALVGWQLLLRPEAVTQWAGSLMLGAIALAVVILDARPMQLAAREASRTEDPSRPLPVLMHRVLTETLGAVPPPHPLTPPGLLGRP